MAGKAEMSDRSEPAESTLVLTRAWHNSRDVSRLGHMLLEIARSSHVALQFVGTGRRGVVVQEGTPLLPFLDML